MFALFVFLFVCTLASAEGSSLCRGFVLPQKIFKFGGYETLFSALDTIYVFEKSTSNKLVKCEKAGALSVLTTLFSMSPYNLKQAVYPSISTLSISPYCMMFGM